MQPLGVAYLSRDRLHYTQATLPRLDVPELDLLWLDDSVEKASEDWAKSFRPSHVNSFMRRRGAAAGPAEAIKEGLDHIARQSTAEWLGYVENDILLSPGWWDGCLRAIEAAEADGFRAGAISPLSPASRALLIQSRYAVQWIAGQCILFRREYLDTIRRRWDGYVTLRAVRGWTRRLGVELDGRPYYRWTKSRAGLGGVLPGDWCVVPVLADQQAVCVASVPGAAEDLDRPHTDFDDHNATEADIAGPSSPSQLQRRLHDVRPPRIHYLRGIRWLYYAVRGRTYLRYLALRSKGRSDWIDATPRNHDDQPTHTSCSCA